MKKKLILMCVAGVLVMTAIIGGTLAGFNTAAENPAVSNISTKELGISLEGGSMPEAKGALAVEKLHGNVPGSQEELVYYIRNNAEKGYTLYTRITIDKKWANPELDPSKIHLYMGDVEDPVELTAGQTVNDWIIWYSDEEQVIMYYTKPMEPGDETTDLIDLVGFDADMNNEYTDSEVLLTFTADAVQTIAAEDAMPSEWGVYPVFGTDGIITSIAE